MLCSCLLLSLCSQGSWPEFVLHERMGWAKTSREAKTGAIAFGTAHFPHLQAPNLTIKLESSGQSRKRMSAGCL